MPRLLSLLLARRRAVPWLVVLDGARWLTGRGHAGWSQLTPAEQRELRRLLAVSKGRPGRMTASERDELTRIVRKGARAAFKAR